jgi:putative hydrolase of the HAD superfamily
VIPSPRAVLFDLFGTLVLPASAEARARALEPLGIDAKRPAHAWLTRGLASALLIEEAGLPFEAARDLLLVRDCDTVDDVARVLAARGGRAASDRALALTEAAWDALAPLDAVAPGALELLRALDERGVPLALVSNCDVFGRRTLLLSALEGWFDAVLLSCEVGRRKPDRRLFSAACAALSAVPEETVMIGDSWPHDVLAALHADVAAVWIAPSDEAAASAREALAQRRGTTARDAWGRLRSWHDRVTIARTLDEARAQLVSAA